MSGQGPGPVTPALVEDDRIPEGYAVAGDPAVLRVDPLHVIALDVVGLPDPADVDDDEVIRFGDIRRALAARPAPAAGATELLTALEHKAMQQTAALWNTLCHVVGTAASAEQDLTELGGPIHAIQHAILAQAAARAYPDRYRLLGGVLTRIEVDR